MKWKLSQMIKENTMVSLAVTCLALTVYFESRGEPDLGKHYVGHVTMNRSQLYEEKDICKVVFDKDQYSWTDRIKYSKSKSLMAKRAIRLVDDDKSWDESIEIAKKVISRGKDITNGAKFFNEKKMGRRYKTTVKTRIIGKHIFY